MRRIHHAGKMAQGAKLLRKNTLSRNTRVIEHVYLDLRSVGVRTVPILFYLRIIAFKIDLSPWLHQNREIKNATKCENYH